MTAARRDNCYSPGLEGIPACESSISVINGEKGILQYRGIPIEELAQHSTFEETAYLLLHGRLPKKNELHRFDQRFRMHRRLRLRLVDMIRSFPEDAHPMDVLRTAVSSMAMYHQGDFQESEEDRFDAACNIIAKVPTILAIFQRARKNAEAYLPEDELGFAGNLLYMLTGKMPSAKEIRLFDVCLILHAEHTLNPSTFTAMVVSSTLSNPYASVSAAIGTLQGPLHGGANERVIKMLREIGSVENVRAWIDNATDKKQKIMGLGHRVYKTFDPRATILRKIANEVFQPKGDNEDLLAIAKEVEKVATEKLAGKGIYPNVDFYSGIVYEQLGIAEDLFTPIFAAARTAGWLSHMLEQAKRNRIFRPTTIYTGEENRPYIPMEKR